MGGVKQMQYCMNGRNAGDIAERKKKKTKRRRKGQALKESGLQQVGSSPNCTDSHRKPKKRRRLRRLQKRELPSDEASAEKEKQSLLAWVEMGMEPQCNTNAMQDLYGDIECFANRISADRSSKGHTHTLTVCLGNYLSAQSCNGDVFAVAHDNGTCDHVPKVHAFKDESQERGQSSIVPSGEVSVASHTSAHAHHASLLTASRHGESELSCLAGATITYQRDLSSGSGEENSSCQALGLANSNNSSLLKGNDCVLLSNSANPHHNNKRKREDDKVLQYVLKRNVVIHPSSLDPVSKRSTTTKTVVIAWGRNILVTLTSEARTVQEWISSQNGNLFGLDVEWRPNRTKGKQNKVALLQLCNESECLIIQMLFLDKKPEALCKLLSDPLKSLAGVGVLADGKRLLHDYGLECQGGIELTMLAVERLKRQELRNAGLKVLVQEVLGLKMDKPKKVTLSNWAKVTLDPAQINYACMDAWASFALSRKLLVDM